jgi:hypothetical protein
MRCFISRLTYAVVKVLCLNVIASWSSESAESSIAATSRITAQKLIVFDRAFGMQ